MANEFAVEMQDVLKQFVTPEGRYFSADHGGVSGSMDQTDSDGRTGRGHDHGLHRDLQLGFHPRLEALSAVYERRHDRDRGGGRLEP